MKRIALTLLVSLVLISLHSQKSQAQFVSSTQARELLEELQDTRSVTNVGVSWLEYGRIARNIQIKLDRFLRTSDARQHPVGKNLKETAEAYILAHSSSARYWYPQTSWQMADFLLKRTEECVANIKLSTCKSIAFVSTNPPSSSVFPRSSSAKAGLVKDSKITYRGYCTFLSINSQGDIVNDPCTIYNYKNGTYQLKWSDGIRTTIAIEPAVEIDGDPASIIQRSPTGLTVKGARGNTGFCWNCRP